MLAARFDARPCLDSAKLQGPTTNWKLPVTLGPRKKNGPVSLWLELLHQVVKSLRELQKGQHTGMASIIPQTLRYGLCRTRVRCGAPIGMSPMVRFYSDLDAPPPPMLATLKGDLKSAMRAKDANRLSVLRSVLAAVTNASKTSNPIQTNIQLLALLRKTRLASEEAAAEFRVSGRQDLVDKEDSQAKILEEYEKSSGLENVTGPELEKYIKTAYLEVIDEGKAQGAQLKKNKLGDVMKRASQMLEGKVVDKKEMADFTKEYLASIEEAPQ